MDLTTKKKEIKPFAGKQMEMETIMLSKTMHIIFKIDFKKVKASNILNISIPKLLYNLASFLYLKNI
jgi:hypothetical protein